MKKVLKIGSIIAGTVTAIVATVFITKNKKTQTITVEDNKKE